MKIKALIVDLDGTILNTIATITYFVNKTFQKYGISPITEQECKIFIGNGARKLILRALTSKGVEVIECSDCSKVQKADSSLDDPLLKANNTFEKNREKKTFPNRINEDKMQMILDDYNLSYDSDPYYLTEKYDGLDALFEELSEHGVKLAVISNKPHSTAKAAAEHFYPNVFDVAVGGRDGVPLKPDPAAIQIVLDELGVSPSEIAYLGDSDVDMLFGKACGSAYTLGVGWGFRGRAELEAAGADEVFDTPDELRAFLKNII